MAAANRRRSGPRRKLDVRVGVTVYFSASVLTVPMMAAEVDKGVVLRR
jgi:hypothetical protein